ncbi:bd6a2d17-e54e-44b4-a234-dfb3f33647b2 [Sclerotinia trifoliorum]|uniref:Bd6a2d17-e54e-44b4-a234-dfb3f33647b2 n=1 Tax=Sclerotinia trifoliorum TaxID=28548 RepID=A0A8H2W1L3_9HELO|nr:bd6a2d17-e54e-44b4-a234-dfb3f33647b2 [Sclerotinia trifoliorum]
MTTASKTSTCELVNTYYQTCNHVTTSLHHATRIIPSKSSDASSPIPSNQTITTCPQAIHNLSLLPPLDPQQKSQTTLCASILKRTVINAGYGCPECEPEYHQATDYITTKRNKRDKKAVSDEDRRKKRMEWCMLAITEWEARKEAAGEEALE